MQFHQVIIEEIHTSLIYSESFMLQDLLRPWFFIEFISVKREIRHFYTFLELYDG
jgi:hypothetical protein